MNVDINLDSSIEFVLSIFSYLVWGLFYYIDMLILYYKIIFPRLNMKIKAGVTC
jgi:uncharacterized membrane protein YjfL (UPF0719 family)